MRLDVAGRHAFRIHGQDLLLDILTDAGLVLFQKLQFKFTLPVTGTETSTSPKLVRSFVLVVVFAVTKILIQFILLAFEDANAADPSILYKPTHFRIAEEETPARLVASRPRIRPARHSAMSQILNFESISFRLRVLILSLFQCLCYREHII